MTPFHPLTRRSFLKATGIGLGSVALDALLSRDLAAAEKYRGLPGFPHHPPKAKRVIFLYMRGGPSHVDTFDYKPKLPDLDGKTMPGGRGFGGKVLASPWKFNQAGQSGLWISELFPELAKCAAASASAPGRAATRWPTCSGGWTIASSPRSRPSS